MLAECSARSYAELIKSNIPSSSSLMSMSARSSASRPPPPFALGVSSFGPTAAAPTRGEILVHLGATSRKPRSAKRKNPNSSEKDQPGPAKVQKLGVSPPSPVREPEHASPPLVLTLLSPPKPDVKAKGLSSATIAPPLTALPITVWNPPSDNAKSPSRGMAEPSRKKLKPKAGAVKDSLLSNPEIAAGAISSILLESDVRRSKGLPIDEALALSFQGVASVSL